MVVFGFSVIEPFVFSVFSRNVLADPLASLALLPWAQPSDLISIEKNVIKSNALITFLATHVNQIIHTQGHN